MHCCQSHARIFNWNFDNFFLLNAVKCEEVWSNMWLPCTVNVQHSVRSTIPSYLHLHKMSKFIQKLTLQSFHNNLLHVKATFGGVLSVCT